MEYGSVRSGLGVGGIASVAGRRGRGLRVTHALLEGTTGLASATMSVLLRRGAHRDGEAAEERQQPRGRQQLQQDRARSDVR
eukprot:scaffold105366_cov60-Phaeocystis_antarctica.AAC.1